MSLLPYHKLRPKLGELRSLTPGSKHEDPHAGLKRTRIIHIINDLSIGGTEMMLYKLLSEANRERFEPIVVSLRNRGQLNRRIEALGIPIHVV